MKELKKVSRWISIKSELITKKHSLWYYADKDSTFDERYAYVDFFRWNGRKFAVAQFLSRYGMLGFDTDCKEYPAFIVGYDSENYYNPMLLEIDKYGEKVRLWKEVNKMYKVNNYIYHIDPERIFDLPCYDRKSFYGKAKLIECKEGRYLQSYNTLVCFLSYGGTFIKLWDGYSATTQRHINAFMRFIGCPSLGGKHWWTSLESDKKYTISDLLNII